MCACPGSYRETSSQTSSKTARKSAVVAGSNVGGPNARRDTLLRKCFAANSTKLTRSCCYAPTEHQHELNQPKTFVPAAQQPVRRRGQRHYRDRREQPSRSQRRSPPSRGLFLGRITRQHSSPSAGEWIVPLEGETPVGCLFLQLCRAIRMRASRCRGPHGRLLLRLIGRRASHCGHDISHWRPGFFRQRISLRSCRQIGARTRVEHDLLRKRSRRGDPDVGLVWIGRARALDGSRQIPIRSEE